MSTQDQARALMVRHQHMVKNREQCLLSRAAAEVGIPAELTIPNSNLGKADSDRSNHSSHSGLS